MVSFRRSQKIREMIGAAVVFEKPSSVVDGRRCYHEPRCAASEPASLVMQDGGSTHGGATGIIYASWVPRAA